MRFLPGLICLLPLLSPLAHAELIDDVNDRGELRIALEANTPPFNFKDDGKLTGFEVELGQLLANELDVRADFVITQAEIKLAPGKHTLQLELGDSGHMPFDPPIVSKKITVNVK